MINEQSAQTRPRAIKNSVWREQRVYETADPALSLLLAGAMVTALLLGISSRPIGTGYLAWIALLPMLFALNRTRSPLLGSLLGWTGWLGIGTTVFEGSLPVLSWAFPVLVAVSGLWWAAAGALFVWTRRWIGTFAALTTFPFALVAMEFISAQRPLFGDLANVLGAIGYTQFDTPFISLARLSSVSAISLLVVGINVAIFMALRFRVVASLPIVGALVLAVFFMPNEAASPIGPSSSTVAIVQGASSKEEKEAARTNEQAAERLLQRYERLSNEAVERGAQMVVWSETILPEVVTDATLSERTREALSTVPAAFVGGQEFSSNHWYNSVFLWSEGMVSSAYRKQALVPIREADYTPGGADQQPVDIGDFSWSPFVCLDSVFPSLSRNSALRGTNALVYLTDDTFAQDTSASYVHLRITAFRAVETGRYAIFANESGPSAIFDAGGEIQAYVPRGVEGIAMATVPGLSAMTPYVLYGDWVGKLSVAIIAILALLTTGRSVRGARRSESARPSHRPG